MCAAPMAGVIERASVHSDVRRFRDESFAVTRCPSCKGISSVQEVDLAYYYASYPFHRFRTDSQRAGQKTESFEGDWMLRAMQKNLVSRLRAAGLTPESSILDYGCGGGGLLDALRAEGFANVAGFDDFVPAFSDRSVLATRYDCVVCQDVIEHVADPSLLMQQLHGLLRPSGLLSIGTPDASAIDLSTPERFKHPLHQPYHRHILASDFLLCLGERLAMQVVRFYPCMYANTAVPFVNSRFVQHYFRCFDDTVDAGLDPIPGHPFQRQRLIDGVVVPVRPWLLWNPLTLFYGFFGVLLPPRTDIQVVFRAS